MGGCFAYGINKSIRKPAWARGAIVKSLQPYMSNRRNRWYRFNFSVPVLGLYVYRIVQRVAQSSTISELGDVLQSPGYKARLSDNLWENWVNL